jgi:hypothetical protein
MNQAISWLIVDNVPNANIGYRAIVESDGTTVCNPSPMGEDNARLIAAAPDLLDALRLMMREYEALRFEQPERWPTAAAAASAAIAKAEGSA